MAITLSRPHKHGNKYRILRRGGPGDPSQGTWISFATEAEAMRERAKALKALEQVRTVGQALREYLDYCATAKKMPLGSQQTFRGHVLRMVGEDELISDIGPKHYDRCARSGKYAVASHHGALGRVKLLLEWCVAQGYLKKNALADVKPVGSANAGKPQPTEDEARLWLNEAFRWAEEGHRSALGALCCLLLPLRIGEVSGRHVRDLTSGGTRLHVVRHDDATLKTKGSRRTVKIENDTEEENPDLDRLRELLLRACQGKDPADKLIGACRRNIRRACYEICDAVGIPRYCPHGMRGLHGTINLEQGSSAAVVARQLGNTPRVLRKHYAQPGAEQAGQQRATLRVLAGGKKKAGNASA